MTMNYNWMQRKSEFKPPRLLQHWLPFCSQTVIIFNINSNFSIDYIYGDLDPSLLHLIKINTNFDWVIIQHIIYNIARWWILSSVNECARCGNQYNTNMEQRQSVCLVHTLQSSKFSSGMPLSVLIWQK